MAQLTREEILVAAVGLLDQGPAALTMRSLADQLGVTAAALYYWFPAKAHLMDAIAEHVAAQIVATKEHGTSWADRLRSLALAILEAAEHHPVTFNWVFLNYATQPPLARIDEAMLDVLMSAGFDARDAVLTKNTILRLVVGHLGLAVLPNDLQPTSLDPASYPRAHQAAAESALLTPGDFLQHGLDCVIARLDGRQRSAEVR